ncbi:MAG: aminoacyl-tRNA hydrolase [Vicinamibacteria bacterium]|nr:aminoacyl-tRNA hydrolase [Vicinamibacteria bacterium]
MRLVVGLGNPGERYRRSRHNIGFMVVDSLMARGSARRLRAADEDETFVAEMELGGEQVLLAKPMTFMNRSGVAVERLLGRYDLNLPDVVVVLDDVALDLGKLRIRERGGHGGHNGLRSVIELLGSDEIARVRVGVRRGDLPPDMADYVLSPFPSEDVLVVQEVVGWAADAVECLLSEGALEAMNRFNSAQASPG